MSRPRPGAIWLLDPAVLNRLAGVLADVTLDRDTLDRIATAVDDLPPLERAVIEGLYWERASQKTVAERLGVSRPTVQRRAASALLLLQECLQ